MTRGRGELWDPATKQAEGIINSETNVKALEFYADLFQFMPPGAAGWFYDEVNNAVHTGIVAMAINWYYFFFVHADPAINPYADKMGYDVLPGMKDASGNINRGISVGGQGLSISKYSKNVEEAWKFLEWFMTKDIQWKWVEIGAQTGRVDVLEDPRYTTTRPWNATFPESMKYVKDYWSDVDLGKRQLLQPEAAAVHGDDVAGLASAPDENCGMAVGIAQQHR